MLKFIYVNKVEILRNVNWYGLEHLTLFSSPHFG